MKFNQEILIIYLVFLAILLMRCNIPRDPDHTLQKVKGDKLMVGITENRPWTDLSSAEPKGVEVNMVEAIAQMLNAEIEWKEGSETELMEALKAKELHLVIGGITKKTPWSKHIGLTNPYKTTIVYIGVPQGATMPDNINNMEVGVTLGTATAEYVRKKGGKPVKVIELEEFNGPVAGYEWELKRLGFQITAIKLHESKRVFAVTRGENAWVMFLEKYMEDHKNEIDQWLIDTLEHEENRKV